MGRIIRVAVIASLLVVAAAEAFAGGAMIRALADKRREREPIGEKLRHDRAMKGPRGGAGGSGGCPGCG